MYLRGVCGCVSVCVGGINPYSVWLRRAHRLAVRSAIMAGSCGVACMRTVAQADTHLRTRGLSLPLTFTHWEATQRHIVRNTHLLTYFYFISLVEKHIFSFRALKVCSVFIFLKYYQQFRDHISKLEISMNRIQTGPVMQRQTQKVQKYLDYRCTRPLKWTMHDKLSVYHATKVWCFINKELMN